MSPKGSAKGSVMVTCMFEARPVGLMSWSDTLKRFKCTEKEELITAAIKHTNFETQIWLIVMHTLYRDCWGLQVSAQDLQAMSVLSDTQIGRGKSSCIPPGKHKNTSSQTTEHEQAVFLFPCFSRIGWAAWPPAQHTVFLLLGSSAGESDGQRHLEWHTSHPKNKYNSKRVDAEVYSACM